MFGAIERNALSKEAVNRIMNAINEGLIVVGDKLPTERELVQQMKISRNSVREALAVLEALSIIERKREGTFLLSKTIDPVILNYEFGLKKTTISQVFESRQIMELSMIDLTVERATPEDIDNMKKWLMPKEEKLVSIDEFIERDKGFHIALVEAIHNEIFLDLYKNVQVHLFQTYGYYQLVKNEEKKLQTRVMTFDNHHEQIINAIISQNSMKVKELLGDHLNFAKTYFLTEGSE